MAFTTYYDAQDGMSVENLDFQKWMRRQGGYDDTVYALKNWGKGRPDQSKEEWARRILSNIKALGDVDDYILGAIDALEKFLKDGSLEFVGSSLRPAEPGETNSGPFSSN